MTGLSILAAVTGFGALPEQGVPRNGQEEAGTVCLGGRTVPASGATALYTAMAE
jgi:hypothetical protein